MLTSGYWGIKIVPATATTSEEGDLCDTLCEKKLRGSARPRSIRGSLDYGATPDLALMAIFPDQAGVTGLSPRRSQPATDLSVGVAPFDLKTIQIAGAVLLVLVQRLDFADGAET